MIPCYHQFEACAVADYERCGLCGTYHSTAAPPPEQIYGAGYWNRPDHSSIRDQVHNVDVHEEAGITKNAFVLDLIHTERSVALEVGCAPGMLLRRLFEDAGFWRVFGVEVDRSYEADIREIAGPRPDLMFGYFPAVTKELQQGSFSLVVGCDIFEHAHEPYPFLLECARLLKRNGQLLLMLPLIAEDAVEMPARFFHAAEHVYLHSVEHMRSLLAAAGFAEVSFSRWTAGHDMVSARKATG